MIKEVIVVEGKNDYSKIKEVYSDADILITNGSEISEETKKIIYEAYVKRGIIIFTDPDYPGTRIRNIISEICPNAKHAFIKKVEGISKNKKKVGIEHALNEVIKESLDKVMTPIKKDVFITLSDLTRLHLVGFSNSKALRDFVSEKLNIGHCNGKTLLSRLNLFGIDLKKLEEVVDLYEGR